MKNTGYAQQWACDVVTVLDCGIEDLLEAIQEH
jgi:hypothetical protein